MSHKNPSVIDILRQRIADLNTEVNSIRAENVLFGDRTEWPMEDELTTLRARVTKLEEEHKAMRELLTDIDKHGFLILRPEKEIRALLAEMEE